MIRLFLTDLDGCLTNGKYLTGEHNDIFKTFYTRDFQGMMMLHEKGITVGVVTASRDRVINNQCHRAAAYVNILSGASDKISSVNDFFKVDNDDNLDWVDISYIGDDVFDIPLLEKVGLPACPIDAHDFVKNIVSKSDNGIILNKKGGEGCVRELADIVMEINYAK